MGHSISTAQAVATCTTKKKDTNDNNVSSNIPQKKNLVSKAISSVSKLTGHKRILIVCVSLTHSFVHLLTIYYHNIESHSNNNTYF